MAENTSTLTNNNSTTFNGESTRDNNYFTPRVDIVETEAELLLYADMPGVQPQDVDLRYENGELRLRGRVQRPEVRGNRIYAEYEVGDYYRVFNLHESINAHKIDAEFKNGVLVVHLPKQEKARPKQVQIRNIS